MDTSRIDEAIFAAAQPSGQKVAMVIATVAEGGGIGKADDGHGHRLIAARIRALVRSGRLAAQGYLRKPRFSEIRLPSPLLEQQRGRAVGCDARPGSPLPA